MEKQRKINKERERDREDDRGEIETERIKLKRMKRSKGLLE